MREFTTSETMKIRQKVTVPPIFPAVKFKQLSSKTRWIRLPLSSCLAFRRIYGIVHMQSRNFELLLFILRMLFEWQNFY